MNAGPVGALPQLPLAAPHACIAVVAGAHPDHGRVARGEPHLLVGAVGPGVAGRGAHHQVRLRGGLDGLEEGARRDRGQTHVDHPDARVVHRPRKRLGELHGPAESRRDPARGRLDAQPDRDELARSGDAGDPDPLSLRASRGRVHIGTDNARDAGAVGHLAGARVVARIRLRQVPGRLEVEVLRGVLVEGEVGVIDVEAGVHHDDLRPRGRASARPVGRHVDPVETPLVLPELVIGRRRERVVCLELEPVELGRLDAPEVGDLPDDIEPVVPKDPRGEDVGDAEEVPALPQQIGRGGCPFVAVRFEREDDLGQPVRANAEKELARERRGLGARDLVARQIHGCRLSHARVDLQLAKHVAEPVVRVGRARVPLRRAVEGSEAGVVLSDGDELPHRLREHGVDVRRCGGRYEVEYDLARLAVVDACVAFRSDPDRQRVVLGGHRRPRGPRCADWPDATSPGNPCHGGC